MAFYRIISRREVQSLVQSGYVPRNFEQWVDYPSGTIICLFEEDDFNPTLTRFAAGLAEQRNLVPGDKLYVLQFFDLAPDQIRPDTTASDWRSSRLYLAPVGIEKVRVVAMMRLAGTGPEFLQPGPVELFNPPRSPAEVLE